MAGDELRSSAVQRGLLSQPEADEARKRAAASGRAVETVLVESGLLAPRTIEALRSSTFPTMAEPGPAAAAPHGAIGPGTRIGEFEVIAKLGEGGMGAVYRARQLSLGREVALKLIAPQHARSPELRARFHREAKAAAAINHPGVVSIIAAGEHDGGLYMALELVTGGDAEGLVKKAGGRLDETRALEVVRDACEGLVAIEEARLVHRDIKPANIFISAQGRAKLADLGLARDEGGGDRMTQSGMIVGTPAFMAPEQADGASNVDIRADVYALGATLFHLVVGRPPFIGNSAIGVVTKVLNEPAPDPAKLVPGLSPATAALIRRTLEKDRANRPQTARDLLRELEAAVSGRKGDASLGSLAVSDLASSMTSGATPAAAPAAAPPIPPTRIAPPATPAAPARSSAPLVVVCLLAAAAVVGLAVHAKNKGKDPAPVPPPVVPHVAPPAPPPAPPPPPRPAPPAPAAPPPPPPPKPALPAPPPPAAPGGPLVFSASRNEGWEQRAGTYYVRPLRLGGGDEDGGGRLFFLCDQPLAVPFRLEIKVQVHALGDKGRDKRRCLFTDFALRTEPGVPVLRPDAPPAAVLGFRCDVEPDGDVAIGPLVHKAVFLGHGGDRPKLGTLPVDGTLTLTLDATAEGFTSTATLSTGATTSKTAPWEVPGDAKKPLYLIAHMGDGRAFPRARGALAFSARSLPLPGK